MKKKEFDSAAGGHAMGIKLPDVTVTLTGQEQYHPTIILQSAKRQMEEWCKGGWVTVRPYSYETVCDLLRKIDPPNPPRGGAA